jgi:glycosyltransferase involved in cell wall biosynthesis
VRTTRPNAKTSERTRLRLAAAAGVIDRQIDKGIDLAIEAVALLRDWGFDDFSLDVYGQVNDVYYPCLVLNRGLGEHVTFQGMWPHADLVERYTEYDVFLFPTHAVEPFGIAPLEAAARGCVPLMSSVCGIGEWLVHGVHVLKAPRNAEAFARSLAAILDGTIDLEPIGRRAAAVAQRDFHIDAIAPHIERLLTRAAKQSRAGARRPEEAYRLALLAEKLAHVLIQETLCA